MAKEEFNERSITTVEGVKDFIFVTTLLAGLILTVENLVQGHRNFHTIDSSRHCEQYEYEPYGNRFETKEKWEQYRDGFAARGKICDKPIRKSIWSRLTGNKPPGVP